MTDAAKEITQATLSEMLPVGMLTTGGLIAQAIINVANRKRAVPNWEAFHYERISDSQFEITGGIVTVLGGVKKWPGPHDTLIISEAEILAELGHTGEAEPSTELQEFTQQSTNIHAATSPSTGQRLQVVFTLPEDEIGRQRILKTLHLHADFFGARVQSCTLLD